MLVRYSYDGVNRLIREDNRDFNESYFFSYDKTGNITSKRTCPFTLEETEEISTFTSEDVFSYDGDKLIAKNSILCAYTNGRPTTYLGKAVTFKEKGLISSFNGVSFNYDNLGRRTLKGSWTYTYNSDGDLYTATNGTTTLTYFYADTGEPLGLKKDNTSYFFRRNLQGDIIAILDSSGNVVVKYVYDAWGNHKVLDANGVEISATTHVGHVNPIRYRGYYYDVETGLYYLQSRYYDPEVGRFISPDSVDYLDPDSINGLNLYAYCGNNPVMNVDPTGHFWESLLNGLKALWNTIVGWVKETVGTFISITFNEHSMNNDFILFGVESGFSNTLLVQGEEKPISFFATNPSEWYKFWEYTIGISINIGKFSYSTTLGIGSHNGSIGWNGYNYDFELSVEKFSLGFSRTVENTTNYSNVYIRPIILLLACMPIANMFQPAY